MKSNRIGITWQLSDQHGWGVYAFNLALELIRNGPCPPLLLESPKMLEFPPDLERTFAPYIEEQAALLAEIENADRQAILNTVACLFVFGNMFLGAPINQMVRGRANIGLIAYEIAHFDASARERAAFLDCILATSSWNRDYLETIGFGNVEFVSQGIDTERFKPAPRLDAGDGRFRIFSGGKLEFRKGQDTVLAAFRQFHQRHPDCILVTTWHNPWPGSARSIAGSPHLDVAPAVVEGASIDIASWATANGVPDDAFEDLGIVPNLHMPSILHGMDVAVFPNRCEGGTNVVAMEAMACGVPCILSANSGHLDIISGDNCYPLTDQAPMPDEDDPADVWRESSLDEIIECLERVYTDRDDAARRGRAGSEFMTGLSWHAQVSKIVDAASDVL